MALYINGVKVSDSDQNAFGNNIGGRLIVNGEETEQDDE